MSLTHKEIFETPDSLQRTKDIIDEKWDVISTFLKGKKHFVFLGCGSSYSLARSMAVMTYMHTGKRAIALCAGDLLIHAPRYVNVIGEAAVICISRSGQTSEMILALDAVADFDPHIASLICGDDTPLEERSELSVNMPWAFDNSVCQTRTVTNFYFAAAYILAKYLDNPVLQDDLMHIINNCESFLLENEGLAKEIAGKSWNFAVTLADAELEGIADNGSLAFKEICQLPSNYYHILDSRHGPMVLFNNETLLLAVLGPGNKLELEYLSDMVAKKAYIVVFSDLPIDLPGVLSISYGRKLSHLSLGIPFIMLCQLISYYKASYTGANPDKPSGLSAWISLDNE